MTDTRAQSGPVLRGVEPARLAVGVAGWDYPDWRDTVYRLPAAVTQPLLFDFPSQPADNQVASDPLAFLAGYVDMAEVNSSFYRIPSPRSTAAWGDRVHGVPGFHFTAKLFQGFTHEFRRDPALAAEFRSAFTPLREQGLLRGLLAQFRYDTADCPTHRDLVRWLHAEFAEFAPMVVEVRHASWAAPDALRFFADLGITVANLDYPTAADSFDPDCCVTNPALSYLRLHGRNRKGWFAREKPAHEPYNYDYSGAEIEGLADRSRKLLAKTKQLTIVANNHYQGKAVSAAVRLKAVLEERKVPVPPALLETYPDLRRIVLQPVRGQGVAGT